MTAQPEQVPDPMQGSSQRLTNLAGNPRACKAFSRTTGKPCGAPAVNGAEVCRMHGGSSPQVKRKAAMRMLSLVDPAIATLAREMAQADKSSDRQRAANSILDRAGLGRHQTITGDPEAARELLIERLLELREEALDSLPPSASTET